MLLKKNRWFFIIFIIGFFISLKIDYLVIKEHDAADAQRFAIFSEERFITLNRNLENLFSYLLNFKKLFKIKNDISRDDFSVFTRSFINEHPEIISVAWIPKLSFHDINYFNQTAINEGLNNFFIKELDANEQFVPVTERNIYFPVLYTEPTENNKISLGFDMGSLATILPSFYNAGKQGEIILTPPINLPGYDEIISVLAITPIYNKFDFTYSTKKEFENVSSYVLMNINIVDFFDYAINDSFDNGQWKIELEDVETGQHIVGDKIINKEDKAHYYYTDFIIETGKGLSVSVNYQGRLWRLKLKVPKHFNENFNWFSHHITFIVGSIFSFFLALIINILTLRNSSIKEQVKQRTKELDYSEKLNRSILDTADDSILSMDIDGNISRVNKAMESFLGYPVNILLSMNIQVLIPHLPLADDSSFYDYYLSKARINHKRFREDLIIIHKDGIKIPISFSISDTGVDGDFRLTGILHDMRESVEAQRLLKNHQLELEQKVTERTSELEIAKEHAEAANHAKTTFLSNMSHELRTPMHGILSYASMGIKRIKTVTPEKNLKYYTNIQTSAERLMGLLNNLLDLAKLESGKIEFSFMPNSLSQVAQSCIVEQQARLDENGINVTQDFNENAANFDGVHIAQVITNLLSNAIKFTARGESIHFTIQPYQINKGRKPIDALLFTILNHGPCIPDKELELIFDKFVQSSTIEVGTSKSTGLGLPISREIVNAHGGDIWAENEKEGAGVVFKFTLPIIPIAPLSE